jgi:HlyD family secretion protein
VRVTQTMRRRRNTALLRLRILRLFGAQARGICELVAIVSATIMLVGCGHALPEAEAESADPPTAVPVHAVAAKLMTLRPAIDLVGTLEALPERTGIISPQIAGQIQEVLVVEGAAVHAGDDLMRLDARIAEAQLTEALATANEKQAILERLRHKYLPEEIEIVRQDMLKAEANMEALRSKVNALKALLVNDGVSSVEYERISSSLRAAEADYAAAKARLRLCETGARQEEIAQAEAQLAIANSQVSAAKLTVKFCHLTSPIDGVVVQLSSRQGMYVTPSTQLATVVDVSTLFVRIRIPSAYLAKVHPGIRADVSVPSLSDEQIDGTIERISGQADPDTGDVDAFVAVANDAGLLRSELSCRVRLWLPEVPNALAVPVAAISDRSGTPVVTTIRQDKAYETEVTLGIQTREYVAVLQGLSPGDAVITEGGYDLPEGYPVKVISDDDGA